MPFVLGDGWLGGAFGLQSLFTLAMLIAAARRGAEFWWFWIILVVQPFGPWAYLLAEVLGNRSRGSARLRPSWQPQRSGWFGGGPSLAELRHRAERSPTVANSLALGEKLRAAGKPAEALPHARAALAPDDAYNPAAHLLAQCQLATGEPAAAAQTLEALLARDPRWSGYRAWSTLIAARDAMGDAPAALEAAKQRERFDPSWPHRCDLARRLLDAGDRAAAAKLLADALGDAAFQPLGQRLSEWPWRRKAQALLAEARQP